MEMFSKLRIFVQCRNACVHDFPLIFQRKGCKKRKYFKSLQLMEMKTVIPTTIEVCLCTT